MGGSVAKVGRRGGVVILGAVILLVSVGYALSYENYSIDGDNTQCAFCHGDFRRSSYISLSDGQNWGNLHNLHRYGMLNGDCDACHGGGDELPTPIGSSDGGRDLSPIGCVGCHGRAQDGDGTGSAGYGLAMQVRHHALNVGVDQNGERCIDCHADLATRVPVGEDVPPVYYVEQGTNHPDMPTDPCNPLPDLNENFAGADVGIDNDGDLLADQDDPDCSGPTSSPGETSGPGLDPLLVTAHDRNAGKIDLSFGVACESLNHNIEYGDLAQVSTYEYAGQVCNIGPGPNYTWSYPTNPPSLFFLVVGTNSIAEGSYGRDSEGNERLKDLINLVCPLPQGLDNPCD